MDVPHIFSFSGAILLTMTLILFWKQQTKKKEIDVKGSSVIIGQKIWCNKEYNNELKCTGTLDYTQHI